MIIFSKFLHTKKWGTGYKYRLAGQLAKFRKHLYFKLIRNPRRRTARRTAIMRAMNFYVNILLPFFSLFLGYASATTLTQRANTGVSYVTGQYVTWQSGYLCKESDGYL